MPERPADVWAGKTFFVKKHCSDDAGHDTRVVTTLGVASYEDWFDEVSALSANINCQALCRRPSPTFSSRTLRCARPDLLPAAATGKSLDENEEGDDAPPSRRLRQNLMPAGYSNEEWTSR